MKSGLIDRQYIREHETIAFDYLATAHCDRTFKYGRIIYERVEFAILSTRVRSVGESIEKALVVIRAGERCR